MGQKPAVHRAHRDRQQHKIFDDPVYNYTRDFPYIWEELHLPVRYGDDRGLVENNLLERRGGMHWTRRC